MNATTPPVGGFEGVARPALPWRDLYLKVVQVFRRRLSQLFAELRREDGFPNTVGALAAGLEVGGVELTGEEHLKAIRGLDVLLHPALLVSAQRSESLGLLCVVLPID